MAVIAVGVQAILALMLASFAIELATLGLVLLWLAIRSACGEIASLMAARYVCGSHLERKLKRILFSSRTLHPNT